jgi:hypothetical protein
MFTKNTGNLKKTSSRYPVEGVTVNNCFSQLREDPRKNKGFLKNTADMPNRTGANRTALSALTPCQKAVKLRNKF